MSGKLVFAVKHAQLCEAIEECAPPVDNSYLGQALRRMRSGAKVKYLKPGEGFWHSADTWIIAGGEFTKYTQSQASAARAYFDLCAQLSPAATPSCGSSPPKRAGPADVGNTASAISFESAATADDAAAPSDTAASAGDCSSPGRSPATLSHGVA